MPLRDATRKVLALCGGEAAGACCGAWVACAAARARTTTAHRFPVPYIDPLCRGVATPRGRAGRVEGGFRVGAEVDPAERAVALEGLGRAGLRGEGGEGDQRSGGGDCGAAHGKGN